MIVDGATLERLSAAGDHEFADALAHAGAASSDGVIAVVDAAGEWAWESPVQAGRVAAGCRAVASASGWDSAAARAAYVEARGALAGGRLDQARTLLETARAGFVGLGDPARARQVSLGLANVHASTGRLDLARDELLAIVDAASDDLFADLDDPADRLLRAKAKQNLAAIEVLTGAYQRAVVLLREAEGVYLDLDLRREWIDAVNNRAIAMLGLGRVADATRAADVVLAQLGPEERHGARAELLETAGRADLLAGRFTSAIERLQEALTITRDDGIDERSAAVELALADVWATLRLHHEAGQAYRSVAAWAAVSGADPLLRWAQLGLGATALATGDRDAAVVALGDAFDGFIADGQHGAAVTAGLTLAAALGDGPARDEVLARVGALGDSVERPAAQVMIELAQYDAGQGRDHLDHAQRLVDALTVPSLQYEVDVRRAAELAGRGDTELALTLLRRAASVIESTRGALASERHRRTFLTDRLRAHTELVALLVDLGGASHLREAFEVAERARSRALLDAMSGVVRRRGAELDTATAERLERFSMDLEALYNGLLGDDELRGVRVVDSHLDALESAMDGPGPAQGQPVAVAPVVDIGVLQAELAAAGAVLVSYHSIDGRTLAFVVSGSGFDARVLPAATADLVVLARRHDAQVARFRAGQAFADRWSHRLAGAANDVLGELGDAVVDPLLDLIGGHRRLVVVPSPALQGLPFAAFAVGGRTVIDRWEVTVAPSASAWVHARTRRSATGRSLVVAAPDDRAPAVDDEGRAVAELLAGCHRRSGGDVTRAAVVADLAVAEPPAILHVACHGVFHSGHSMFSALRLNDGWFTAHELAACRLDGALTVLSACESGRVAVHAGDEVVGLPRAALMAGARDVVASSWLAHDHTTASLMVDFHASLAGGAHPAEALRSAQLAARDRQPHPFYWAAFTVLGAGWHGAGPPTHPEPPTCQGSP